MSLVIGPPELTCLSASKAVKSGEMVFTSAGHNPPLIKRADASIQWLKQRHGPVVGAVEDIAYKEDRLTLAKNDVLLMYTDGVTEAMNISNELYSETRLENVLTTNRFTTVTDFTKSVFDSVKNFEGEADQADDITILTFLHQG